MFKNIYNTLLIFVILYLLTFECDAKKKKKKAKPGEGGLPTKPPKKERKKKPKKHFGMGAENVTGGALVQIENPDESSTSDQAFTLEQLQGRVWWQEQKCAAMPMRR